MNNIVTGTSALDAYKTYFYHYDIHGNSNSNTRRNKMAGKYKALWLELKLNGRVAVAINPAYHKNMLRNLASDKERDIGYKILLGNLNRKAIMTARINGSKVELTLTIYHLNGLPVIEYKDL